MECLFDLEPHLIVEIFLRIWGGIHEIDIDLKKKLGRVFLIFKMKNV